MHLRDLEKLAEKVVNLETSKIENEGCKRDSRCGCDNDCGCHDCSSQGCAHND